MTNRALPALVIAAVLAGGCADTASKIEIPSPGVAIAADNLNPEVTPPPAKITISENLPLVAAPAGFIDQATARDKAVNAMQKRRWGGVAWRRTSTCQSMG
jgi:hypothetical protein